MENVNLNLACRWFIGYDLHEAVPIHSSLTKIRERFGLEAFQMKPSSGGSAVLGYKDHYIFDGGKQRIIHSEFVMPASI
jgi:hypothetical protein